MKRRVKTSLIILFVGVAVNVALALIKTYVGLGTNSLCIMLDAVNGYFDVMTAIVTAIAFLTLLVPRGERAPHGYGRTEYLAGFVVAVTTAVVGGLFMIRSVNRMAMPEPVWYGVESIVLISVTVPIKLGLGLLYYFAEKKIKSSAFRALALDSFLDVCVTLTTIISFAVSSKVDFAADAIFGVIVSIAIIAFAIKAICDNVKFVVTGDGAKEEKAAISALCEENGLNVTKTDIHDYGYGAKTGVAYVDGGAESLFLKMSERIEEETGAKIIFIAESKNENKENNDESVVE